MCGRFSLTREEAELEKRFQAKFYSNDLVKRYNVAPSQLALVMTNEQPQLLQMFKWGLIPSWAKDAKGSFKTINAKSETLLEKPSFKNLIKSKRCLVISDGFYEWKHIGKQKQPYRICVTDNDLFAFGGLWDSWIDKETGECLNTFTIITTPANSLIKNIHDRMPLILDINSEKLWIDSKAPMDQVLDKLKPYPSEKMQLFPVSTQVNSPANDNSDLILPLEFDQ
jgi:putative SOS response-associated peptidase YedK